MNKIVRKLGFSCLLLLAFAGNAWAQTSGRFVIKRTIDETTHYLAHIKNGSVWELQDVTAFNPNCIWISDNTYAPGESNKNYYFYDGDTPKFLAAPEFEEGGELTLSTTVPTASDLGTAEQQYYFYRWDSGLGRGVQYNGVTDETCEHYWEWLDEQHTKGECWEVYWVAYDEESDSWKMSEESYNITDHGAKYNAVTVYDHPQDTTTVSGGLTALDDFEIEVNTNQTITPTIDDYSYSFTPAYTQYIIDEAFWPFPSGHQYVTHNYWGDEDHGENTPIQQNIENVGVASRRWTLSGDGAEYLSFDPSIAVTTSTANEPTVYYRISNDTGHKTATLQLTVTYNDGAKQRSTATITVKTPCQNPAQAALPTITDRGTTVSWYPTAESYTVYWQKQGASSWESVSVGNVTSYTFTGLDFETTYRYKVQASCVPATTDPTPNTFTTLPRPSGLMVFGAVFGGGRMADVEGNTEVVIINSNELSAVYGGNDIAGEVKGANGSTITLGVTSAETAYAETYGTTETNIKIGDVYGGGNGYYAYNGTSFEAATSDYTEHEVAAGGQVKAMTQSHTVGETVWTNASETSETLTFPSITKTSIMVNSDNIKVDSLFGGAKNAFLTLDDPDENGSSIVINGGTIFAVFGGNNFGGTQGSSKHHIEVLDTKTETEQYQSSELGRDFGIGYLFGGGNKVLGSTTDVHIIGGQCDTVFAGGNSADVLAANVYVECTTIYTNAGTVGSTEVTIDDVNYPWNGTGIYNIRTLFGGNNRAAMDTVPNITLTQGSVGTVYGGGNAGDMLEDQIEGTIVLNELEDIEFNYGTHIVMNSNLMLVDYLYGGCQMSNVLYSTWVELRKGHVGTVYGGCNISGDVGSTRKTNLGNTYPHSLEEQKVYGATYVMAGGNDGDNIIVHKDLFAGSNGYYNCSQDGIHYNGDANFDDPTGQYEGLTVPTHNETYAMIRSGATIKGNVYAGGNLACVGFDDGTGFYRNFHELVGLASLRMDGGTVEQNVYGGGNMASIYGVNEVRVSGGTILGGLYGGNDCSGQVAEKTNRILPPEYMVASDDETSLTNLGVKTYVGISGNAHIGTVYGGGNGDYLPNQVSYCYSNFEPIQSYTFVDIHINGGSDAGHIGTVYGGGNGVTVRHGVTVFLNIQNEDEEDDEHVDVIFGGNNKGNLNIVPNIILLHGKVGTVYGGCNQGAMIATGKNTKTIKDYENIGSYVRLLSEYDGNGDGTSITPTAKVTEAVYGGCRMNGVTKNTLVLVEGGNYSSVRLYGGSDISGTVADTSQVVIEAGSIINEAYGGGNGNYNYSTDPYSGLSKPFSANTRVDMLGGTANNLYAGAYAGECGNTNLNVLGGTVIENAFGGGYGATSSTTGDAIVNIGNATSGPTVNGNVYGGSSMGQVNDASTDLTQVNVMNGTLNGDVYGGGKGVSGQDGKGRVNGKVEVNIGAYDLATDTYSGGAIFGSTSKVFGCNDAGESPQDDVTVNIYSTGHNDDNAYPYPDTTSVPTDPSVLLNATASQFAIQAVYGGGNLADYAPANATNTTTVHIWQCKENTVKDVFGGSNLASAQNTRVIIDGGRIDRTFGGGNGQNGPAPVVGTARTEINAGLITQVFGGSNTNGNVGNIELIFTETDCPKLINEVFNGSNEAPLFGEIVTDLVGSCDFMTNPNQKPDNYYFYGGTNLAPVYGNVTLNVYGGYYVNVFGGSKGRMAGNGLPAISADIKRYPTSEEITNDPDAYPAGLAEYLADHLADHDTLYGTGGNVTLNIYGGKIENAFGGSDVLGDIEGKITVNVLEGGGDSSIPHCDSLYLFNVYGGGNITVYDPNTNLVGAARLTPEVNIIHGTVKNNVFGGGLGETATINANPVVTIGDVSNTNHVAIVGRRETEIINGIAIPTDYGNVYGGGELDSVVGNTKVLVQQAHTKIQGTVYGGGKGSMDGFGYGLVTGNALVDMTGGLVQRSIYGGGELGSVGTFTDYYEVNEDPLHLAGEPKTCQEGTGLTKVLISGGQVGINQALMPNPEYPVSYDDYGYVFCASKGALSLDSIANLLAAVDTTYLEISDSAVITASVYGGSENGQVLRNTYVKIKGGQIGTGHYVDDEDHHHWDDRYAEEDWETAIDSIRSGKFTHTDVFHQCDAWPFNDEGHRYVYDFYATYGPDSIGNYYYDEELTQLSYGGSNQAGDGHSYFGNVFGGGSGYYPVEAGVWRRSAGRVCGDTYVEVTGGHILTNIYGGNELTDVLGHSKVVMKGGTLGVPRSLDSIQARPVNSYLFGAGMGDPRILFNGWSNVASTEVIVDSAAVIFGSVFGGGEDGHVMGNAHTTIQGNALIGTLGTSSVDGNIFGGGRGFSGIALTAGVVCGNVYLDIKDNVKILGSVFGGGRLAAVGTDLKPEGDPLYGVLQSGSDHGNITVNISGGTIGNKNHLNDSEYSIGDVYGGSKGTLLLDVAKNQRLGLSKNTNVTISQAAGKTTRIYGSVYGGGEIASVGAFNYATDSIVNIYNETHTHEPLSVGDVYELAEDNTGIATVTIKGGTIGQSDIANTKGNVFGSCLGKAGKPYSGYSYVDKSFVILKDGLVYGSIFGGGENGHVLHDTDVEIKGGTVGTRLDTLNTQNNLYDNIIFRGNVYGGGRGIDVVTDAGPSQYSITAGKVSGNTKVNITGGLIYRNVYGGGSFASVGDPDDMIGPSGDYTTGKAVVRIAGGQIGTDGGKNANDYTPETPTRDYRKENGFVFGSGRGVAGMPGTTFDSLAYVNNAYVTIDSLAYVTGSVFGGAENGHVKNRTLVTVNQGSGTITQTIDTGDFATYPFASSGKEPYPVIGYPLTRTDMVENLEKPRIIYRGNVYGGGRGIDPYDNVGIPTLSETSGMVQGNSKVVINGGTVRHDVYGGGSMASVGTLRYDTTLDSVYFKEGTGLSEVYINGGIIGIDSTLTITKVIKNGTLIHNLAGINNGQVFGGGRGESGNKFHNLAFVGNTKVVIEDGIVYGAVFGGGCNGHVKHDTRVEMTGGTIGHALTEKEKDYDFLHPDSIYFGNVYGGGRGIDHSHLPQTISRSAGQVFGNTHVQISGGRVHHDVYGGGSLANVGVEVYDSLWNVTSIASGGHTYVDIIGNAIIGTDGKNAGFVYGSGRGRAGSLWSDMAFVDMTHVTIGTEGGKDNPQVRGSVFGGGSNGHVEEHTYVTIHSGVIGTKLTADEMVEIDPSNPGTESRPRVYRGNVYGGGRGLERNEGHLSITAGRVFGNTNVTINGGTIYHNIYGGGSMASVGTFTLDTIDNVVHHNYTPNTGKAIVTINAGEIGMSPTIAASVTGATQYSSGLNNGQVYGSGRGEAGSSYKDFAFVNETQVNILKGNIYGAVFGGGANGHVKANTQVNIQGGNIGFNDVEDTSSNSVYRGNVYGGGRGIDINTEDPTMTVSPTAGKVYGNTEVNITGGTIYRNVFGGGSLASVGTYTTDNINNTVTFEDETGETTINVRGGVIGQNAIRNGCVFGSGRGYPNPSLVNLTLVNQTHVNIFDGAIIKGNVYGSGDNGQVYTEANIVMTGGTVGINGSEIDGNLFGSGRGVDTYEDDSHVQRLATVAGQVHGNTNVTMSGGLVKNNIFGGGYMASVAGDANVTVNGDATVGVPSNENGGKVFGAGCGVDVDYTGGTIAFVPTFAKIHGNTFVNINGANVDILSNVYGGGLKGAVGDSTHVILTGATVNNVYGAGQGVQIKPHHIPVNNADVCHSTNVTLVSGTVNGSVYGGGEFGSVGIPYVPGDAPVNGAVSTVSIEGGHVMGSVFGGGNLGFNKGATFMNLGGNAVVDQNIFGGAYGSLDTVYVAGLHTVNMRGGTVYGNVYGGSRNANDALDFNGSYSDTETRHVSVVNISGGHAVNHVFASGYFGKAFGSVYAYIGTNAIMNAPHNTFNVSDPTYNQTYYNNHTALIIDRDVWAGADYGDFTAGQFGAPTISGQSNIYVDGQGYDTENALPTNNDTYQEKDFMILRNSIYGCGTSCDAASTDNRHIIVRNYGKVVTNPDFDPENKALVEPYTGTTRELFSIQRADSLIIDNANINLIGQGIVNSFSATEKYSIQEFNTVCVTNNSSIFINKPVEQIKKFGSYTCPDVYAATPVYAVVPYTDLDPNDSNTYAKNKVRVNQGTHLSVVYRTTSGSTTSVYYGELEGYFFMMTDGAERTFAFARPKQSKDEGNTIATIHDNPLDGGFVSYHIALNTFDAGTLTGNVFAQVGDAPGSVTIGIQIPYENHAPSRSGEAYFRVWRYSDPEVIHTLREGVLNAIVRTGTGTSPEDFCLSEPVRITLPPSVGEDSYYRIQVLSGEGCNITYGTEYFMVNGGLYDNEHWMYARRVIGPSNDYFIYQAAPDQDTIREAKTYLRANPNNAFGLVAVPVSGLSSEDNKPWLICNQAAEEILNNPNTKWVNNHDNTMPEIDFYLTYSNAISGNNVWDPVIIFLEQYNSLGQPIDEVEIRLTITTTTDISQTITTETYALMFGNGSKEETYTTKILLPAYNVQGPDHSVWSLTKVEWKPVTESGFADTTLVINDAVNYVSDSSKVAMTFNPSLNFDNSNGWANNPLQITPIDLATKKTISGNNPLGEDPIWLGETDGRHPISFNAILHYDASIHVSDENTQMGTVELTLEYTNQMGTDEPQKLTIKIEVWRKGKGHRYYIDGVHGAIAYDGTAPDAAKPNLANILYFTNFTPGDIIYIVDQVTVTEVEEREWNGQPYDKLRFYRYDGHHDTKHELHPEVDSMHYYNGFDYDNNPAYLGPLLDVKGKMTISSSLIDGSYKGNPYHNNCSVSSEAPLINVSSGGQLTLIGGTIYHSDFVNNYNNGTKDINAGGINIESGGTVRINNFVYVQDNLVEDVDGGGVYVAEGGTLILSDLVTINNNKKVEGSNKIEQNVYLPTFNTNIHIGTQNPTDIYGPLEASSKVGITKTDWKDDYYYMPVLYGEDGSHLNNLHCKNIVFDDQGIYRPEFLEIADPAVADPEHHLFFVHTWTSEVRSAPTGFDAEHINTPEELAWAISLVNGLNGQTPTANSNFTLTGDIDMSANIWDVLGNTDIADTIVYSGTFEGNGHLVKGIHSQLDRGNMGMFGKTVNATISNLMVEVDIEGGTAVNLGTLGGNMEGGTISNVETMGILKGKTNTENIGGVIGKITSGTLHSSFAINTIQGSVGSTIGGLVGTNSGNLYNSYSNMALGADNAAITIGGLAGNNTGTIENCYVEFQGTEPSTGFGWFANANTGHINYSYTPTGKTQYIVNGTQPSGHGNYGPVKGRKEIGYMYDDNAITLVTGTSSDYFHSGDISYDENEKRYFNWNGLLWSLNKWVKTNPKSLDPVPTPWFRPTSANINGDLPVLGFTNANSLGTTDGIFLRYGSIADGANGLDTLLTAFNDNGVDEAEPAAYLFLYGSATDVNYVPESNVSVFVNEDACLKQSNAAVTANKDFGNTTVGITFDNSSREALDHFQNQLEYDWHLMSTPLSNAKVGATYSHVDGSNNYLPDTQSTYQESPVDIESLVDSYFPNGLTMGSGYTDGVKWDFYSYFEPKYHWINLKRNKNNHFHQDALQGVHDETYQLDANLTNYYHNWIDYTESDQASVKAATGDDGCIFTPGKGYMMAISQESYMNSTGTLNKGTVIIPVTAEADDDIPGYDSHDRGSNLVGNPYQAYLDLDQVQSYNSLSGFWIYDADQGVYAPYDKGASENPAIPSQHIHPHQGFFVVVDGNKDLTFNYGMASAETEPTSYFREERLRYPLVNLYVFDTLGNRDLAIVEFNRPEVGGVKKIDNLRNANFKLNAHFIDEDYGLLYTPRKTARIPVFFKTPNDGTYTLRWDTHNGTFTTMRLIDNLTGVNYDMLTNDHYTFQAEATDYASRFYIVFNVTSVDENEDENEIFAYFNGDGWVVEGQGQLELVDMLGQVLYADHLSGESTIVHFNNYAAGVYMLRLVNSHSILKAQKIVIQ